VTDPEPYETRFSAGEVETVEVEDGVFGARVPAAAVLYPGEWCNTTMEFDPETGIVTYQTVIEPAPGFRMRLRRWSYLYSPQAFSAVRGATVGLLFLIVFTVAQPGWFWPTTYGAGVAGVLIGGTVGWKRSGRRRSWK
jgi:hypothetical protein